MNEIKVTLEPNGKGLFSIENNGERQAEMIFSIEGKNLTVYHTEVSAALKGQNAGTSLLNFMADYAREHHLMVIALCPFVSAQFTKHPEKYGDIWNRHWHDQ